MISVCWPKCCPPNISAPPWQFQHATLKALCRHSELFTRPIYVHYQVYSPVPGQPTPRRLNVKRLRADVALEQHFAPVSLQLL